MSARRIGILGGTFDPIHCGHLDIADAAVKTLGLSRMFVIPSNIPPHRPQPFASPYHRFAMAALAVAGRDGWRAADLELRAGARSYTSATLEAFHDRSYSPSELFFVIGADAFADIGTWRDYPKILDATHFVVVARPGSPVRELPHRLPLLAERMVRPPLDDFSQMDPSIILIEASTTDVSSTTIRRARAEGQPIDRMVPASVQQHIEQHGLYTAMTPGRRASDRGAAGRLHSEEQRRQEQRSQDERHDDEEV
jgi:nicotinate-nucleotide adenylyltransferase